MKPSDYLKHFRVLTDVMNEITKAKNHDYGGGEDAFKNFELIEKLTSGRVTTAEGIIVRLTDKLQRVTNLLHADAKVKDEKISDTLIDLAVYSLILCIYLTKKK